MRISPLVLQSVTARLHTAIGVDPTGLDVQRLEWILQSRCRELHLGDASAYAGHLAKHPEELERLVDEVVVRETRFFRDPGVFSFIRQTIANLATTTVTPLRVLSAPCSTGEEAYSLSAIMQLMGVPASRYTVDACDVSAAALQVAKAAEYPDRAMANVPAELRTACAESDGGRWIVHPSVRTAVNFVWCNLAQPGALGTVFGEAKYHIILCRNLFIYLAPAARACLAKSLHTALVPGGKLFIGTADRVEELATFFAPVRPASSFAYVHRTATSSPRRHLKMSPTRAVSVTSRPHRTKSDSATPLVMDLPSSQELPTVQEQVNEHLRRASELLQRALELRRRGDLFKSEQRCRQALYLAPNLLPALELLQILWSEHPNLRMRRALRDRVLRHRLAAIPLDEAKAPAKEIE